MSAPSVGGERVFPYRVLQLTDAGTLGEDELCARVERMTARCAVILRDPGLSTRALLALGRELRERTRRVGAGLLVSDRLDVGLLLDADGVHLGRASVAVSDARKVVGARLVTRSAHDHAQLVRGVAEGADALLLSPIFASPGKGGGVGLEALVEARRALPVGLALIALGGINASNADRCFACGADGVAAIRADLTPLGS